MTMISPAIAPAAVLREIEKCSSCEADRRPRMFVCAFHEGWWGGFEANAAGRWDRLTEAVSILLDSEKGRFVVLADDLSLLVTDDLEAGDVVIYDRAEHNEEATP